MTTLEVLKAAREHLSDPARWIKDDFEDHEWTGPADQVPCCAVGAVYLQGSSYRGAIDALAAALGAGSWAYLGVFNDDPTTTHADILALFDRAIAAEEARQ